MCVAGMRDLGYGAVWDGVEVAIKRQKQRTKTVPGEHPISRIVISI